MRSSVRLLIWAVSLILVVSWVASASVRSASDQPRRFEPVIVQPRPADDGRPIRPGPAVESDPPDQARSARGERSNGRDPVVDDPGDSGGAADEGSGSGGVTVVGPGPTRVDDDGDDDDDGPDDRPEDWADEGRDEGDDTDD